MEAVEQHVRSIEKEAAFLKVEALWEAVHDALQEDQPISRSMFLTVLCTTLRCILARLEEGEFIMETWKSYLSFFTEVMLSYGTSDMIHLIMRTQHIMRAVLTYSTTQLPILANYMKCSVQQMEQRRIFLLKRGKATASKGRHLSNAPLLVMDQLPDLELTNPAVVAVAPTIPMSEVIAGLRVLPDRMTFVHPSGVIRLKHRNPLPIPPFWCVTDGYTCDTCHVRPLEVAYQAMLYDEDDDYGKGTAVRSDAQIAMKARCGFDLCMVCAVYFYTKQVKLLQACAAYPFTGFRTSRSTGIFVRSAGYQVRRTSSCVVAKRVLVEHASPIPGELAADASGPLSVGDSSLPHLPVEEHQPHAVLPLPVPCSPPHCPSKRLSRSLSWCATTNYDCRRCVSSPPHTRCCATVVRGVLHITVCVAPWGARPIVWRPPMRVDESVSLELSHGPPSDWRDRVKIRSEVSYHSKNQQLKEGCSSTAASLTDAGSLVLEPFIYSSAATCSGYCSSSERNIKDDSCVICLSELCSEVPTMETACRHWFHVECLLHYIKTVSSVCPVCRSEGIMPDLSCSSALEKNVFHIRMPLTEEEMQGPEVRLVVGSLISSHGHYENPTHIGAATSVCLSRGQLTAAEQVPLL